MDEVEVLQVIRTTLLRRGSGDSNQSPIRIITQYWTMDGQLLFEIDPCSRVVPIEDEVKSNTGEKE